MFASHDSVRASFSYPDQDNHIQAHDRLHDSLSEGQRKVSSMNEWRTASSWIICKTVNDFTRYFSLALHGKN